MHRTISQIEIITETDEENTAFPLPEEREPVGNQSEFGNAHPDVAIK